MEKVLNRFSFENMNEFISSSSSEKNLFSLPNNLGYMFSEKNIISENIYLFKSISKLNKKYSIETNSKFDSLFINVILQGSIKSQNKNSKKIETVRVNSSYIKYVDECNVISTFNENSSKSIEIMIKKDFLEKNFSKLLEIHSKDFASLPSITLKNQTSKNIHLANDLYNSPFEGELQNIYLQSKVLELIYNEFSEMLNKEENEKYKTVKLTQDDIEALHKVQNFILLENDFSDLMTFSRKVALNEFKLKYGFKQLFNTTIGQLILEQKMTYAKYLLETSEFSISEISHFVGYKHQQNFSSAFSQFFGILPRDIMIKRSYYY
ncbi:helix-turn-helix transcriptional regulator [Aliarcobacter lanthieri]|uniref:helix-turn-helix transcriptional regulator n=1 Tax=Aliarcobacter lanthieri TaxID=1355374 RepID=UPI000AB44D72|nr:helix-turn-helix domain-containing protein [Aliarcobacter lanthieri]QKF60277.1 transcriptional regulator, AraC family [Aliarcobacter lanthieri]